MQPGTYDLVIYQGDTKRFKMVVKNGPDGGPFTVIDITGCTPAAQIRDSEDSAGISATFACTVTNAAGGETTLLLTPAQTAAMTPGEKVWDFQILFPSTDKFTYIKGKVTVLPEVTRV